MIKSLLAIPILVGSLYSQDISYIAKVDVYKYNVRVSPSKKARIVVIYEKGKNLHSRKKMKLIMDGLD